MGFTELSASAVRAIVHDDIDRAVYAKLGRNNGQSMELDSRHAA
jgi:hypothetical protein